MNSATQFTEMTNPADPFAWELLWQIDAALAEKRLATIHRKSKIKITDFGTPIFNESGKTIFLKFETKTEKTTKKSIFVVFMILVAFLKSATRILNIKSTNSYFEHATLDASGVSVTLSPKLSITPIYAC